MSFVLTNCADLVTLPRFRSTFRAAGLEVVSAESGHESLAPAARRSPDLLILDMERGEQSSLDLFSRVRQVDARTPVVFITGQAVPDAVIQAMKEGVCDHLLKPLSPSYFRDIVQSALASSRRMRVPVLVAGEEAVTEFADAIIGQCLGMQEVYQAIGQAAANDDPVLIIGESGTGKDLVARAVYQHGSRAGAPFQEVNCAVAPERVLESALFGHEKGAFPGADHLHIGKLEQCRGGTLLLDAVEKMLPQTQDKVLQVWRDHTFERLGGKETIRTDVRLLAATNQDPDRRVARNRSRPPLFTRLKFFSIRLPPLRSRGEDLGLLVAYYLRRFNRELGRKVEGLAPGAMAVLQRHRWPGNVHEFQDVLKYALLQAAGRVLETEHFPAAVTLPSEQRQPPELSASSLEQFLEDRLQPGAEHLYAAAQEHMDRVVFPRVLQYTSGNQRQAAKLLGITRGYLRKRLSELGIAINRAVESGHSR